MFSNHQINIKTCVFVISFFLFSSSLIAQQSLSDSKFGVNISEKNTTQNVGHEISSVDNSTLSSTAFSNQNFLRPSCQTTYSVDTIKACDSYTWHGITFTSSNNTATWIGVNSEGCDSVVTLNLTITPTSVNSITEVTCDSYTWYANEVTYTESGTYTYVNECEVYTLDLSITPTTINITTDSACESYVWAEDGNTYTHSGTFTSVFGCHIEILKLKIYPLNTVTYAKICDLSSYTWAVNGEVYNAAGTYTFAYNNVLGCLTVDTLNLILLQNLPASVIITSSVNSDTISCGSSVTFTATPTNGGDAPIYQWKLNGVNIGSNSPTFTIDSLRNDDVVSLVMISYDALPTAILGEQQWSTVNLNLSTYRNGDVIPQVTDSATWANLTTGAWCYYNNDSANGSVYGKLYNWYAINDPRGLAPPGYHIPTRDELYQLVNSLGGENNAGALMIESNSADGFIAKPGGACLPIFEGPHFFGLDVLGYWWTSTVDTIENEEIPFGYGILFNDNLFGAGPVPKYIGFSARCIRNEIVTSGCYLNSPASSNEFKFTVIPDSSVVTIDTCDSYVWEENGITYNISGIYTVPDGCNLKVLNLTITTGIRDTTDVSICDAYLWSANGQTYTQSGSYSFVEGCNTSYLNLVITASSSDTTNASSCDAFTWSANGQEYTQTGTYSFVTGCHTSYLQLTITPRSSDTTIVSSCDSYFWLANNQTYNTTGTYSFVTGCHTSYLQLTITASSSDTTIASSCDAYTWSANGQQYTQTGTYSFVTGCYTSYLQLTVTTSSSDTTTASSCDSYIWLANSQTYTTTGSYSFVTGCHTAYLNVTITASSSDTTNASSCDDYTWTVNGQRYTNSGTYSYVNDCHTSYLLLTITASSSDTTIASVCDSYIWSVNGQSYIQSGNYSFIANCHTSILQLTINKSTTGDTTAFACSNFEWYGTNYTSSANPTHTITNAAGCDSILTLHLTIKSKSFSSNSLTVCDSLRWNGTTYSTSGIYTWTGTNAAGCDSIASLNLTVNKTSQSATSVSASSTAVNLGTAVTLSVDGGILGSGANWKWYKDSCNGLSIGSGSVISVTPNKNTIYFVRAEGTCNITSCVSVSITLNCGNNSISSNVTNNTICSGSSITLTAIGNLDAGAQWRWDINCDSVPQSCDASAIYTTSSSIIFSPTVTTTYYLQSVGGACGVSSCVSITVFVTSKPASPALISGNKLVCSGTNYSYSISSVLGAIGYTWTVPANSTIVSGQGTTNLTLSFTSSFTSGTLSVVATNCGGSSTAKTLSISKLTKPSTPGTISGTTSVCPGTNFNYSISSVFGATSYTWTAPANSTIISGQGTTNIIIAYATGFTGGTLCVIASNCGGNSTAKTLTITKATAPVAPSSISGPTKGVCQQNSIQYSTVIVSGATSYNWTVSSGATIASGQGTNVIVLNFSSTASNSNITLSVSVRNNCGVSTAKSISISTIPSAPCVITGNSKPCKNANVVYSVGSVYGASSYTWTVPSGWSILSGQNTASINVKTATTSGSISVKAKNNCGSSTSYSITTSIANCSGREVADQNSNEIVSVMNDVILFPNPSSDLVNFNVIGQKPNSIEIYNAKGQKVLSSNWVASLNIIRFIDDVYFINFIYNDKKVVKKKLIKN